MFNKFAGSLAAMIACLVLSTPNAIGQAEGRIGDLLVTATGVREISPNTESGFHNVHILIVVRNTGKNAVCAYLKSPLLESTFGLETTGYIEFNKEGRQYGPLAYVNQLLPGRILDGEVQFRDVRDGTHPLRLHIQQRDLNQGCGKKHLISPFRADEVTLKLDSVPKPDSTGEYPELRPALETGPEAPRIESPRSPLVFVTNSRKEKIHPTPDKSATEDSPVKPSVLAAISRQCPQIRLAADRQKADYVLILDPATISHKNRVTVKNHQGDILQTSETTALGNAVKDACRAMLRDFPKQ